MQRPIGERTVEVTPAAGLRLGIITPIVTLLPRSHNPWEVDASVDDLVAVAQAADRLGYHSLGASEHVAVPTDVDPRRGLRYWDLLSTLSFLAAKTQRIRLATNVVVLPYHHPLEVLKRYSTLDRLSGGRLILGVGVGSLQEEFALLGRQFAGRDARADDAIRAIRAGWGKRVQHYHGTHFSYDDFNVDPIAVQERVEIWVGGRTERSLRRAVELGDGWVPFLLGPERLAAMLARARQTAAWQRRERPLEIILWPEPAVDALHDADRVRRQAHEYLALGATILNYRFRSESLAHHLDQMARLVELLADE
jgi:probable F420-dependent oxidoreductase